MHPDLSPTQKLLTLFLGRTRAGVASQLPHAWMMYAPNSASQRFEMFRGTLLFHRMLHSADFAVRPSPASCCASAAALHCCSGALCVTPATHNADLSIAE
jgi:hypothetical protein